MRGIAHQRKPWLHVLQRMATRQRKRTSGKRCNVTQTRREMLRDFRLELCHIHILQLANTRRRVIPHQRCPVIKQRQKRTRSVRSKLLPGAVAGIVLALDANQHARLRILPCMNANSRHLPHLRICAVGTNHQLRADRFTALQFQLLKIIMAMQCNQRAWHT